MSDNCPVCKTVLNEKTSTQNLAFSTYAYDCPRCGKFVFTFRESDLAMKLNYGHDNDKIFVLSHNIRKRQENDSEVPLDGNLVDKILKGTLPTPAEQKDLLIQWIGDNIKAGGDYIRVNKYSIPAIIGARTNKEFYFIFEHLKTKGVVKNKTVVGGGDSVLMDITLTFSGREYYEELKRGAVDSRKTFIAMESVSKEQTDEIHDNSNGENTSMEWDVFICHTSEDKEEFVRPLAISLISRDLKVWYDEFTLTVGDSLRRSINKGLANSRYGIVVISPNFLRKDWPQKELDGLDALEVNGRKVILPVWHQIDVIGVRKYSPILADRVATSSEKGIEQVTIDIFKAIEHPLTKGKGISLTHKFPDQHQLHNVVSASEKKFKKVKNMMPELITEFKTDLSTEDNKLIREFFVLPNKKVLLGGSEKPRLVYYEEEHKGLRNKIDILENQGFLIDVTPGNAPIYRMTEEFVELIIKYG